MQNTAGMKTTAELAADLEARGADLEWLALRAARIAAKRGTVDAGRANGTSIIAAAHLGFIKRDRRRRGAQYTLTRKGAAVLRVEAE